MISDRSTSSYKKPVYRRFPLVPAKNKEPYQQAYYPPVPTGFTKYMRTSFLWQLWRFLVINFKMLRLLMKSHN